MNDGATHDVFGDSTGVANADVNVGSPYEDHVMVGDFVMGTIAQMYGNGFEFLGNQEGFYFFWFEHKWTISFLSWVFNVFPIRPAGRFQAWRNTTAVCRPPLTFSEVARDEWNMAAFLQGPLQF